MCTSRVDNGRVQLLGDISRAVAHVLEVANLSGQLFAPRRCCCEPAGRCHYRRRRYWQTRPASGDSAYRTRERHGHQRGRNERERGRRDVRESVLNVWGELVHSACVRACSQWRRQRVCWCSYWTRSRDLPYREHSCRTRSYITCLSHPPHHTTPLTHSASLHLATYHHAGALTNITLACHHHYHHHLLRLGTRGT